jgi:hypothetical protein
MADPTVPPIPVADRPTDPQVYQPVAGLAIAGILVAGVYTLILGVLGLSALASGSPLLLGWPVWIGLPAVGAALGLLARRQIRASEGTRSGMALANWAWWLSVLGGLGYGAYFAATYLAVRLDSGEFAQQWFERLKKGQVNLAFLDTQDPGIRGSVDAEDDEAMKIRFNSNPQGEMGARMGMQTMGMLDQFQQQQIVRAVLREGPSAQVKAEAGLRDWDYAAGRYKVKRQYLITTREGDYDFVLTLHGGSSSKGEYERRQWSIDFREIEIRGIHLSPYGRLMIELKSRADIFMQRWADKLALGQLQEAYLETCEPSQRDGLNAVFQARAVLLNGNDVADRLAGCWQPLLFPWVGRFLAGEFLLDSYMPGYAQGTRNLIRVDEKQFSAPDDTQRQIGLRCFKDLFQIRHSPHPYRGMSRGRQPAERAATVSNGRLECVYDVHLLFEKSYRCAATVTVQSEPDFEKLEGKTRWRVARIEAYNIQDMERPSPPRGAGGAPGKQGGAPGKTGP